MIIECPNCGTKNSVIGELVTGKTYRCGSCNSVITILRTEDIPTIKTDDGTALKDEKSNIDDVTQTSPEIFDIVSIENIHTRLNPTIGELASELTAKSAFENKETPLNPTLEDALYKDNVVTPIEAKTNKNSQTAYVKPENKIDSIPNNSGQGVKSIVPKEIQGWNWGAFAFSWIWGLCNNAWLALIALVPALNLIISIISGAKGNEWAWQNKRWDSLEQFQKTQKQWSAWGLGLFLAWLIIVLAPVILIAWLLWHVFH